MGMYSSPAIPPAPDYAASTKVGVETNAALLPFQLAVDRAARLGTTYTDPATGKTYDFTGMGDATLAGLDADNTERLMRSGADISRDLEKNRLNDLMGLLPQYNELNLAAQKKAMEAALEASGKATQNQYEQDLAYRPKFGDLTRSEDMKTFLQNLDLGEQGTRRMSTLQNELLPETNRAGLDAQKEAMGSSIEAMRTLDPERYALRQKLAKAANEDLDAGSSLTPEQLERMQQNIRGAQAARGNILGAGAGYDEARMGAEMGQNMQQQRRASALAILQGGDVRPNFQAAAAVNPLMPNYQSTGAVQPNVPSFQATTAGGPNLSPTNINQGGAFSYINPGAGGASSQMANQQWSQLADIKSKEVNPWMAGLGLAFQGLGAAGGIKGLKAI